RHQPGIMAKQTEPAAEMMRPDTGLHADQAGRHIGKPCFHLPTRPLLPKRDCPTSIQADDVKPVLADIDTDRGDHTLQDLGHDVLLSFRPSCQPTGRQGPGARPDHPITGHGAPSRWPCHVADVLKNHDPLARPPFPLMARAANRAAPWPEHSEAL